ncbi:MAG: fibronectin type III domain-containing protein, partial [Bacteroidales bacterium]|nr:fibronectin type III domain-containing protein [Bacteroidales bacterium]
MKKVLLMFAFIATLLVGSIGTAGAQVNYTVYDGTNTSGYVPVYGYYCDDYLKCEYVIPADHLTAINGSTISALKFYSSTTSANWGIANFRVFLKEVASPTISAFSGYADATEVYMGSLSISGNEMVVNFTTNYTYNGGNLLIGFYNETEGSYSSAYFYGKTISGSSVQGNGSSLSSITASQRNFIPKTTFTVDELHGCLTPTNLAVSDVATYGATVTWTPGNTETDWVVKFNDDEYPVSGTPSYTVTGLTPNTSYVASVKAVCGGTEESEYTTPGALFTTLPTCPAPTAVTVSNITTTSADIAWTNGGEETAWVVKINNNEYPVSGTSSYTVTGLNPSTEYTVNVKAVCSEEDESDWSNTTNFATECGTFMVTETTPYFQGFESTTFPPTCWSRNHTAGTATTSTWSSSTYTVHQGAGAAQLPDQNVGNRNDLVTSLLNIPAANAYQVDFWMYRSTYSSLKPNEGVKVWVNTTPDTVGATEIMYIHREYTLAPAEEATGWYEYSAVIPTSGDMYVIFQGISEWGTASYIDDITVNKAPSCLKPTAVTVSNVTAHTADIAWTNGGTETAWTIDYNGTEIAADSNPFTLTGLDAATNYTVKVKANCSEESESEWSTIVNFLTECETNTTFPYVQDFEATTFPPTCWSQSRTSEGNSGSFYGVDYPDGAWARNASTQNGNATGKAQLRDTRAGSIHALVTGAMDFTYENGYILSVDVCRNATGTSYLTEGIRIFVNSEPEVNANATELAFISRNYTVASTVNPDIVGTETASGWYTYELPITATGVNYIIF